MADTSGIDIELAVVPRFTEDVIVAAVRAPTDSPMTKRDIPRTEIEQLNYGQEMPFLLERVPSLTQYSDSGAGTGYSYLSLRGIPQTRMNITLDGVPLNEPEDSAFYFANFGDFASAIESIQVQRGVGTSTVGSASFVGSVNFASVDFKDTPTLAARIGGGSLGTARTSLTAHSGALGGGVKLFAHAAYQEAGVTVATRAAPSAPRTSAPRARGIGRSSSCSASPVTRTASSPFWPATRINSPSTAGSTRCQRTSVTTSASDSCRPSITARSEPRARSPCRATTTAQTAGIASVTPGPSRAACISTGSTGVLWVPRRRSHDGPARRRSPGACT